MLIENMSQIKCDFKFYWTWPGSHI